MAKKRKTPPKDFGDARVQIIVQKIPRMLRDKFKGYCARRGISMRERIIELMRQDVNNEIETFKDEKFIRRNSD